MCELENSPDTVLLEPILSPSSTVSSFRLLRGEVTCSVLALQQYSALSFNLTRIFSAQMTPQTCFYRFHPAWILLVTYFSSLPIFQVLCYPKYVTIQTEFNIFASVYCKPCVSSLAYLLSNIPLPKLHYNMQVLVLGSISAFYKEQCHQSTTMHRKISFPKVVCSNIHY